MKIKYRITLLFTLVVTAILLIVCISVYSLTNLNRENDFRKRLRNRALTTVSLLTKVEGIDTTLLRRIDENMVFSIQQKSVVIYDDQNREIYRYVDSNITAETADKELLEKVKTEGQFIYTNHRKDIIAIEYFRDHKKYVVIAAAYDKDGLERLSQLKFVLTLSFITGILITLLSGLFFSSRVVVPIKKNNQ